jgi:hypothetical protein
MLKRKSSAFPLNLPTSGGSLTYSMIWSRTRAQNCFGGIQTAPRRQTTLADLLVVLGKTDSFPEQALMGIPEKRGKVQVLQAKRRTGDKISH